MLNFAKFRLAEIPAHLELHCEDALLQQLQAMYPHSIASQKKAPGETSDRWRVSIWLDGAISEEELYQLIDSSYKIIIDGLNEHDKQLIAVAESGNSLEKALESLVDLHNLSYRRDEIKELVAEAILLRTKSTDESVLPLGQSKIGGVPDLPEQWPWPLFDGKPLAFLAQVNLSEIPQDVERGHLPHEGILYFFSVLGWQKDDGDLHPDLDAIWDRELEDGFSRVLYFTGQPSSLTRRHRPKGIRTFRAAAVDYLTKPSLPQASDYARDPVVTALEWSEEELERLDNLAFDFNYVYRKSKGFPPGHQLLGYAECIQNEVTRPDTRLLFQVDSDYYQTGMEWGDGGMIYFVIGRKALEKYDFSGVTAEWQCG